VLLFRLLLSLQISPGWWALMGAFLVDHIPELIALAVLLGLSGFFSGSEAALMSLTREQIRAYERGPGRAGKTILRLLADPRLFLATVLVGNTFVNICFYSVSFRLSQKVSDVSPWWAGVFGVASLFLVIIFGEVTPKSLAVMRPETFSRMAAVPLGLFQRVAWPAAQACVSIVRAVTEGVAGRLGRETYVNADELKMLVEMAEQQRVLDHGARSMIHDVVDLSRVRVKQIMTHRVDMARFQIDSGRERLLELVQATRHKRYPVYSRNSDDIAGVLHVRDVLLNPEAELRALVRPAVFVPETQTVERLLRQFREQGAGLAIVVDEYGGTAGMVTIEDVLEEIVGEIDDEYDEERPDVQRLAWDTYLLPGNLDVESWREMFETDMPSMNVDTLGGLVMGLVGRMPAVGDRVVFCGLELTVAAMRRRRVESVRVRLLPKEEEARA